MAHAMEAPGEPPICQILDLEGYDVVKYGPLDWALAHICSGHLRIRMLHWEFFHVGGDAGQLGWNRINKFCPAEHNIFTSDFLGILRHDEEYSAIGS
jgi:hypothetical protein